MLKLNAMLTPLILGAGDDYILGDSDYTAQSFDWTVTPDVDGNVTVFEPVTELVDPSISNNDVIYAGAGADVVWANAGDDVVYGEGGVDHLMGNDGNDFMNGGEGNDKLWGDNGNNLGTTDLPVYAFTLHTLGEAANDVRFEDERKVA